MNDRSSRRMLRGLLFAALMTINLAVVAYGADAMKKEYRLPSGDAAATLKLFAQQSGEQIVYPVEQVRGVQTKSVTGSFTAREALDAMLVETSLRVVQDEKTGAISITRNAKSDPNDQPAAQKESDRQRVEDGRIVLDKMDVEGKRESGLINEGVIPRQENQAIPYVTLTRLEIEATGATDINEVFRSLPQVSSFESETQSLLSKSGFSTFGAGVTPATRLDMRGFGVAGTTILVNGRRMPLVRETQGGGPDLGRIPLSSIERIEVLPSSAGGMYGTNSMGGVINIILRKEYTGRELTVSYGQATAGGANEVGLTYTEGRSLFGGKANLTWTLDARDRKPMYYRSRPIYKKFLELNPAPDQGGTVLNWYNTGAFFNFASIPGVVIGINSSTFLPEPLNIPGATGTVNYAEVPLNQDGTNLTPASFLPGANKINPYDPYGDFALFNPSQSVNFNATFNHEIIKDRLSWYAEIGLGQTSMNTMAPPNPRSLSLSATDARNPFRAGVVAGYPGQRVILYYYPTDMPGTTHQTKNRTARLVLGVNGKFELLGHEWKWALDGSSDYNARQAFGYTPDQLVNAIFNASATVVKARAFYQQFADHEAFPNTTAYDESIDTSFRQNDDYVWLGSGVARLNGAVYDLPAGPIQVSLLAEYNSQYYINVFKNRADQDLVAKYGFTYGPNPPINFQVRGLDTISTRATVNTGAELVIPVLGDKVKPLGIHALDINASMSRTKLDIIPAFDAYNLGVRFQPIPDVTLRASYGTGTYPAQEFMLTPSTYTDLVGVTTQDPRRGNTQIGTYTSIAGGMQDLRPEQTQTWNYGVIIEPRMLKGFSATIDYGIIDKIDGINSISLSTLLANEQYFPGRIERAAPSSSDATQGWAGQILSADLRRFNISKLSTKYIDTSVRYFMTTQSMGSFNFILRTTNTREYATQLLPITPVVDTLDQILSPLKFRGSGSISWRKGKWTLTPSWSYIESYRDFSNIGVDDSLTTNLQVVYNFPAGSSDASSRWRSMLKGTQWTLGVNNLLDGEPPYVANPGGQNFRSYISSFDDPRGRYVYMRIRKTF